MIIAGSLVPTEERYEAGPSGVGQVAVLVDDGKRGPGVEGVGGRRSNELVHRDADVSEGYRRHVDQLACHEVDEHGVVEIWLERLEIAMD